MFCAALLLFATAAALELEEATAAQLQQAMASGELTSRAVTERYLQRITALDRGGPTLRSVIELNPDALAIADALDKERKEKGPRGPLHGIPILIKDNIDTADRMATSAGSLALASSIAQKDAPLVERLRAAGAVILGKTNMSEWANIRSNFSLSGWSARGGLTKNPYALDRNPCGSSSGTGVAIAANLAAIGVGTETDGSIICPSAMNGIVGIKPTLGLISQAGIIPISHEQDTAGPMARTVADAALLLGAMSDKPADYSSALDVSALKVMRIGVVRGRYFGYNEGTDRLAEEAIADLKAAGATIIDPVDLSVVAKLRDCEVDALLYEFKVEIDRYLGALGPNAAVHSLAEAIAFNERERPRELPFFGQDLFITAQAKGPLTSADYKKKRASCRSIAREQGIDRAMKKDRLDALFAPTTGPAFLNDPVTGDHFLGASTSPAAVAGYPNITVPAGFVFALPVGVSFFGRANSEAKLIAIAYAYEHATRHRRPPQFLPTAVQPPASVNMNMPPSTSKIPSH